MKKLLITSFVCMVILISCEQSSNSSQQHSTNDRQTTSAPEVSKREPELSDAQKKERIISDMVKEQELFIEREPGGSAAVSATRKSNINLFEKELPSLPLKDVRFCQCLFSKIHMTEYAAVVDYIKQNTNFRNQVNRYGNYPFNYSIGKMHTVFSVTPSNKAAEAVYNCKNR
jgi:hypothetical protein